MVATHFLRTRVTPETKARVSAIAQRQLLTESIWLRRLIVKALHEQESVSTSQEIAEPHDRLVTEERGQCSRKRGHASRLFVRIRTEDQLLLRERAAARGMASATYVSVLVRSHLRAVAPLPKDELVALKHAVGELGAIGRNLNQITRAMNQGVRIAGPERGEFEAILKICKALRDHTKGLIKCNAASWASGNLLTQAP
jgi:Bacterial mobilisation protein (MobC)